MPNASSSWLSPMRVFNSDAARPSTPPAAAPRVDSSSWLSPMRVFGSSPATPARDQAATREQGVLPTKDRMEALIRGMTHTESRGRQFDAKGQPLTSPAGAIGISQVMPATAPEAARLAGLPFDDHRYRHDEGYNLQLGSAYLREKIREFGGDESKGVAAYNTGAGNVRKAMSRALKAGTPDAWINHVADETRKYVPGVIGRANQLYKPQSAQEAAPPQKLSSADDYSDAWDNDQFAAVDTPDDTTRV